MMGINLTKGHVMKLSLKTLILLNSFFILQACVQSTTTFEPSSSVKENSPTDFQKDDVPAGEVESLLSEDMPVNSSSNYDGTYPPTLANDGVLEGDANQSWWASAYGINQHLEIDLGRSYPLTRVKLYLGKPLSADPSNTTHPRNYQIQVLSEGQWKVVVNTTDNAERNREHLLSDVMAQKVRFICTEANVCRLREFQIYGLGSANVINHAPVIGSLSAQRMTVGESLEVNITAADEDEDSLDFLFANTLPDFASFQELSNGSWKITFNPQAGDEGSYNISVTVSDGEKDETKSLAILVEAVSIPVEPDPEEPVVLNGGWKEPALPTQTLACVIAAAGCSEIVGNGSGSIWHDVRNHSVSRYAGKTLCIRAGTYKGIWFEGIKGTQEAPLKIINCGGQVISHTTNYQTAISFGSYSRYILLTGTGSADHRYGIVAWAGGTGNMLDIGSGSSDVTIEHLEIHGNDSQGNPALLTGGSGIAYRTYPNCNTEEFTEENWAIHNAHIRNNYIHDTKYEGIYLGQSHYGNVNAGGISPGWNCSGRKLFEAPVLGSEVVNNRLENIGNDAYQIAGAINGFLFQANRIKNFGLNNSQDHASGIQIGGGSKGLVKNNWIETEVARLTQGLKHGGTGETYYVNNVVKGTRDGIMILRNTDVNSGLNLPNVYFYHNTVINSSSMGMLYWCSLNKKIIFANNILAGYPAASHGAGGPGGSTCFDQSLLTSFNGFYQSMNSAGFVNAAGSDFHLSSSSPAENVGKNLKGIVDEDFEGTDRSLSTYDFGAFEK